LALLKALPAPAGAVRPEPKQAPPDRAPSAARFAHILHNCLFTLELDEHAAVHEAVQDGGGERGVAPVPGPVVNDPVRGNEGAASKFVALVQVRLQLVSASWSDVSCQK
jgi:hypothetical protein